MKKVLVVGGAGYIGSHMIRLLSDEAIDFIVLDDLSSGHRDSVLTEKLVIGDVGNSSVLDGIFIDSKIDAVMHFASFIQVGESVSDPGKYYDNNVAKTLTLLNAMTRHSIRNFIFSSTAAIFGNPVSARIDESHPQAPINPYGRSKWMIEQVLGDFEKAHGLRSVCLRYFNAAGAQPDGSIGEWHEPETHLIPLAIEAALGLRPPLKIFGTDYETPDGTCVRDYIHVCDLAQAHLLALDHLRNGGESLRLNLGNQSGYSVKQVIDAVSQAVGSPVPFALDERREGDPAFLVANATQAEAILGWFPENADLAKIVADAVRWHSGRR